MIDLTPPNARFARFAHQPDLALLGLRLVVGTIGIYHGVQKLFGWWGGPGVQGFAGFLETLGVPLPTLNAYAAGAAELFGGFLVAIGVASRLAALPFAFTMAVAIATVHRSAFGSAAGGMEFPLLVFAVLLAIALQGPGRYTLPALVRRLRARR